MKIIKSIVVNIIECLVCGLVVMILLNWYNVFPHISYVQAVTIAVVHDVLSSTKNFFNTFNKNNEK